MARVRQVQSSVGLPVPLGLMRAGSEGVLVELGLGEEADLVSFRVRVRSRSRSGLGLGLGSGSGLGLGLGQGQVKG